MRTGVFFLLLFSSGCSGCSQKNEPQETPSTPDAHNASADSQESTEKQATAAGENERRTESSSAANKGTDRNKTASASNQADYTNEATPAVTAPKGSSSAERAGKAKGKLAGSTEGKAIGLLSAKEAQELARKSLLNAKNLAKQNKQEEAFQELLTSWQEVRQHKDNPSCRALANELLMALKNYGEQLNEVAVKTGASETSRKPITIE